MNRSNLLIRRRSALVAGAVALGLFGVIAIQAGLFEAGGFAGWLAEVRGADEDRGWDRLNRRVHVAYGGEREAYLADVSAADWDALVLDGPADVWEDDGFVSVEARLVSEPETIPLFLLEHRIVHAVCDSRGEPIGIGVFEDRRPFVGNAFEAGGLSGGQMRCDAALFDAAAGTDADGARP